MANTNAEALAQAFVKQTEVQVQKNILEFAFRALLATGITADDLDELVDDVLYELRKEPNHNVDTAGTSLFPSAASMKAAPSMPDVLNTKITELETKLHALENAVKGKPTDPISDFKPATNGGTGVIWATPPAATGTGIKWATPPPTWEKLPGKAKKDRGFGDTVTWGHGGTGQKRDATWDNWSSEKRDVGGQETPYWSPEDSKSKTEPKGEGSVNLAWGGVCERRTSRDNRW